MTEKARHALPSGYVLGEYRIDDVLGQGGFGITYIGEDIALEKRVAIKEYLPLEFAYREGESDVRPIDPEDAEDYRWGLNQFLDEAKTLAKFHHPNIVQVLRFYEANGTAYIMMPFHDGESLAARMKQRKKAGFPEDEILDLVLPLLDGLETVHAGGILHRDIKPGNIFITADGEPILLDFGSARADLKDKSSSLTAIVSRGYAPIEQYSRRGHQGPWTDIYAMAAVMYHMIFGEEPPEAAERVMDDPMVPVVEQNPKGYSRALLAAIDHGLGIRQEERPADIAAWRLDLEEAVVGFDAGPAAGEAGADTMLVQSRKSRSRRRSSRGPKSGARKSLPKSAPRSGAGAKPAARPGAMAGAAAAIPGILRNLKLPGLGKARAGAADVAEDGTMHVGAPADAPTGASRARGPVRRRAADTVFTRYRWAAIGLLIAIPFAAAIAWVISTDTASNDPRFAVLPLGPSSPLDAMPAALLPSLDARVVRTVKKDDKPKEVDTHPIKTRFNGARMLNYSAVNGMQSETRVTFAPGGVVRGTRTSGNMQEGTQTSSDTGKWWVKGDRLCVKWNRWDGGASKCYAVSGEGSQGRANGAGSLSGAFRLYK